MFVAKITCYMLAGMCVKIKRTLRSPVLFLGGGGSVSCYITILGGFPTLETGLAIV